MALFKPPAYMSCLRYYRQYSVLNRTLNKSLNLKYCVPIQCVSQRWLFWEKDRKGGYDTSEKVSTLEHLKKGFKELKYELVLWRQEMKELIQTDPLLIARPGNIPFFLLFLTLSLFLGIQFSITHNSSAL